MRILRRERVPRLLGIPLLELALGGLSVASGACTLTQDEFIPPLVSEQQASPVLASAAAPDAGQEHVTDRCSSDAECGGGVCAAGSCASRACTDEEGSGCQLALAPPAAGCHSDADCAGGVCQAGTCVEASCQDGQQNGDESATDCGGHCAPCSAGKSCRIASDCASGVCDRQGRCTAPSCSDGLKNQDEGDVDCGGGCDTKCIQGASCRSAADCASGVCSAACPAGVALCCQSVSCSDGVRNGSEPVIDCGNAECGACQTGHACTAPEQCQSGLCQGGLCAAPPCSDAVRDGSETDVDCGGNDARCARCALGRACASGADCSSEACLAGHCTACADGMKDGDETDIDCGGSCGPCIPGRACAADTDCTSGVCQDARCCGGNTLDCIRCARRLAQNALQCSTAGGPDAVASCDAFLQCLSDHSNVCTARYAPGCSAEPDAVCSVAAFGGQSGPGVQQADHILGTLGCSF